MERRWSLIVTPAPERIASGAGRKEAPEMLIRPKDDSISPELRGSSLRAPRPTDASESCIAPADSFIKSSAQIRKPGEMSAVCRTQLQKIHRELFDKRLILPTIERYVAARLDEGRPPWTRTRDIVREISFDRFLAEVKEGEGIKAAAEYFKARWNTRITDFSDVGELKCLDECLLRIERRSPRILEEAGVKDFHRAPKGEQGVASATVEMSRITFHDRLFEAPYRTDLLRIKGCTAFLEALEHELGHLLEARKNYSGCSLRTGLYNDFLTRTGWKLSPSPEEISRSNLVKGEAYGEVSEEPWYRPAESPAGFGTSFSSYAPKNSQEHFAEGFVFYLEAPDLLKNEVSGIYAIFEGKFNLYGTDKMAA
jgi:hypothetical protein